MTTPYMKLYWQDYESDTAALSLEEHGAYLMLIKAYWQAGGPLPDDDARMARLLRITPKKWRNLKPIAAQFFTVCDGFWSHKRLDTELEHFRAISLNRKENGKKGGVAKATANAKASAKANAVAKGGSLQSPTPESETPEKVESPETPSEPSLIEETHSAGEPRKRVYSENFERFWQAYPRKTGGKLGASRAYDRALKQVAKEGVDDPPGFLIAQAEAMAQRVESGAQDQRFTPHAQTWLNNGRWEAPVETLRPVGSLSDRDRIRMMGG